MVVSSSTMPLKRKQHSWLSLIAPLCLYCHFYRHHCSKITATNAIHLPPVENYTPMPKRDKKGKSLRCYRCAVPRHCTAVATALPPTSRCHAAATAATVAPLSTITTPRLVPPTREQHHQQNIYQQFLPSSNYELLRNG